MRALIQLPLHVSAYLRIRVPNAATSRLLLAASLLLAVAISPPTADRALGDVIVNGSVSPGDNPFTVNVNEGLPFDGNGINFNVPDPPVATDQNFFEGLSDIIIGVSGPGDVTINNGSFLRYQDLIVGDSDTIGVGLNEEILIGTGRLSIIGLGAYYNNDPTILPAGFPPYEDFGSLRDAEIGYDLYVGRTGFGEMLILSGARAEIQDAVVIGDSAGSEGYLEVSGLGTHLSSGGFSTDIGVDEIHQLIVGRFGYGSLNISGGGRVFTKVGGDGIDTPDFVGAVIGGEAFLSNEVPKPGGEGRVTVGASSRWTIQASLQVGGFHNEDGDFGPEDESEGDNVVYATNVGKGTLTVFDLGLVTILPLDVEEIGAQTLMLAIGQRSRVELAGGRVNVGTNVGDTEIAARNDQMQVVNDGVITGRGEIHTGIFRNRYLGTVEVLQGQRMVISATAGFADIDLDAAPMVNWGVIRVIGNNDFHAELEFDRIPTTGGLPAPFQNRQLTAVPLVGRAAGLIHVQNGKLRFGTGLENQGTLAFTGGDNLVVGNVVNLPGDGLLLADGVISVDGIGTHVVFEDDLTNGGVMDIASTVAPVDVIGNFETTGTFQLELTKGAPFRMNIIGDALLDGILKVSLFGASPMAGDAFGVLAATRELSGIFTGQVLPTLGTDLGWTVDYDYILDTVTLRILSLATVTGADFNGDGVVDGEDLAIWETNFGITDGATALQGDADGDGDVDGDDYDEWLMQLGPVPPGSGAGTDRIGLVPEPSGIVLLATSALFALALRRRKH